MRGNMARRTVVVPFAVIGLVLLSAGGAAATDLPKSNAIPATYGNHVQPYFGSRGFWRHNYRAPKRWWKRTKRFSYRQWRRHCRPVSKVSHDSHGERIRVGGTLCLNRYGQPYIVPGSRFTIRQGR